MVKGSGEAFLRDLEERGKIEVGAIGGRSNRKGQEWGGGGGKRNHKKFCFYGCF